MEMTYVGVDVSKDRLDVHILPEGTAFAVARDGKGLAELVERMGTLGPERIAVEATGGFETVVAAALAGASLPVVVVNPAQVRHFAQALGQRAKTDPIDALMVARFVEATKPDVRPLADEATQLLGDLVARRRQIIEMIVAERNRERALRSSASKRASTAWWPRSRGSSPRLMLRSTLPSEDRPYGARKKTCWLRSPAWGQPSPAPSWPNCRSSARSAANKSQAWPASPRSSVSPANGRASP